MRFSFTRRMLMATGSALALTIAFTATNAFAGSNTGNLSVSATVASTCTISQASALTFTGYDRASGSPNDATGSMTIACTNGGSPTSVSFNTGANSGTDCDTASGGAQAYNRCLSDGTDFLAYNVYTSGARSTRFGLTGTSTTSVTSTGAFSVYGRITAGQAVETGSYTDTLVATVNF
jgi:spore coat protein U-like protein